jgi:hypothetical protein
MSKIITIDEDLFRIPSKSGSRKKRKESTKPEGDIKIKSPQRDKPKTMKRNHVLKFIRQQQEDNYKKMMEGDPNIRRDKDFYKEDFQSSFGETLEYLMNLAENEKTSNERAPQRHTFRNREPHENVSMEMPNSLQDVSHKLKPTIQKPFMQLSQPVKHNSPSWGCMKNGNLPTFRNWKTETQKVREPILNIPTEPANAFREIQKKRIQQIHGDDLPKPTMVYPKQRRTVRRTYKVGKSKIAPRVAVLVSNRTIRNRVSTESQLLKQTPIEDVRRYLVKKGFIKVGSSCPNEVLRKMHETAKTMCGEMENHNPDNLLYNFFNNVE